MLSRNFATLGIRSACLTAMVTAPFAFPLADRTAVAASFGEPSAAGQHRPALDTPVTPTGPAAQKQLIAEREPLARYVPIQAGIYFRMSRYEQWRALLPGARSVAAIGTPEAAQLFDSQDRVVALPSWRERNQMITICRPNDAGVFARLLKIPSADSKLDADKVKVHHVAGGLWAATDGRVFVLSDIGTGSALFDQSVKMLSDPQRKSLLDDVRFRDYMLQVDPAAAGVLFVDESWDRRLGHVDPNAHTRPAWLPNLESGCVQIDLGPGEIRCKLRATRRESSPPLQRAIQGGQLELLPPSAIAVWMMPLDMNAVIRFGTRFLPRQQPSFYRQLARTLETYDLTGLLPLSELGPRCTCCMLPGGRQGDTLRLACILEAKQAPVAAATLAAIARAVSGVINTHQATAGNTVAVETSTYKDHHIHSMTITRLGGAAGGQVFGEFHPSLSALAGRLVVASDPGVIRELIDAAQSSEVLHPVWRGWAASSGQSADDTQIRGFADLEKIAEELGPLRLLMQADDPQLLDSEWFQSLRDAFNATPVQLGARLRKDNSQTPGKVYVMHVLEGRPADGKLRIGDYITGIDGELLSLASPTDDLRKKLRSRPSGGPRKLRIERHGQVREIEIVLPKPSNKSLRGLMSDTGNAIGYLAVLGEHVEHVSYRQYGGSAAQLNAEIVVKLRTSADRP